MHNVSAVPHWNDSHHRAQIDPGPVIKRRESRKGIRLVFTDPTLTVGVTQAKGVHITELRTALAKA